MYQRYHNDESGENEANGELKPRALIIDGAVLITIMNDDNNYITSTTTDTTTNAIDGGLKLLLLELTQRCKAVVACRVSPDQKRAIVNLIKTSFIIIFIN